MKVFKLLKNPTILGWFLWFLTTLALSPLCVMLLYRVTYDTASTFTRVSSGIFFSAILAGILVTLGNEIWYRTRRRQISQSKKENRRSKKKSSKKRK
jgi:type VI protein secretion system component VasK